MGKRFIKLYDQITKWEWYRNGNTCRLFLHLLLKANYADSRFEGKVIRRGEVMTSLPRLIRETGMTEHELRTALKHLIATGEVTSRSTSRYRVITVVKYSEYQDEPEKASGRCEARKEGTAGDGADGVTGGCQSGVRQASGKCQAGVRQASGKRQHHKKNIEEYRNTAEGTEEREGEDGPGAGFSPPTVTEVADYVNAQGLRMAAREFVDYYQSNGWRVGSNPMRDWRAAARTWARRQKERSAGENPAADYSQRDYSGEQDRMFQAMLARIRERRGPEAPGGRL